MAKINLVKLFTADGPMHVDTAQLANTKRKILTIFTARGNRLSEVGKTTKIREIASVGVHRDNLYASQELADAAIERFYAETFGKNSEPGTEIRKQSERHG